MCALKCRGNYTKCDMGHKEGRDQLCLGFRERHRKETPHAGSWWIALNRLLQRGLKGFEAEYTYELQQTIEKKCNVPRLSLCFPYLQQKGEGGERGTLRSKAGRAQIKTNPTCHVQELRVSPGSDGGLWRDEMGFRKPPLDVVWKTYCNGRGDQDKENSCKNTATWTRHG